MTTDLVFKKRTNKRRRAEIVQGLKRGSMRLTQYADRLRLRHRRRDPSCFWLFLHLHSDFTGIQVAKK